MSTPKLFSYLSKLEENNGIRFEESLQLSALWIRRNLIEIERLFEVFHPFFTLHDHRHSDSIANHLYEIADLASLINTLDERALSRYEIFYLLASTYLHDVGMLVCLPEDQQRANREAKSLSEIIRDHHHERSAQFVNTMKDQFLLSHTDVDIIASLCRGHRLIPLNGPEYDGRHDDRNRPIRVRLLTGLLRIADELDLAHSRAPERQRMILEAGGQIDPIARKHWMKHYYTESVWFSKEETRGAQTTIKINVDLLVPDATHAMHMRQQITQRITEHLDSVSFNNYGFRLILGDINDTPRSDFDLTNSVLYKQDVRILYVDDDAEYREEVASALNERGFIHCDTLNDSASASAKLVQVASLPEQHYHQIILDLRMPDLNGFDSPRAGIDLIPAAQKLCPDAQITIFTSSSGVNNENVQEARRRGVSVIFKDQGFDALAHEIESALAQSYIVIASNLLDEEFRTMREQQYVPPQYRVLIVDDDPDWAEEYTEALNAKSIDVDCVAGAKEASERLKNQRYHAAIIDKNMPDLNGKQSARAGIDLLEYIFNNYPDISCLILTKDPTLNTYKEASELGMFDYHGKEDKSPEEIAEVVLEMFQSRLVTVKTRSGYPLKADRMYFYGKSGTVIKKVSIEIGDLAGAVNIDNETWRATTMGTPLADVTISEGVEVRAGKIMNGAIVVTSGMY